MLPTQLFFYHICSMKISLVISVYSDVISLSAVLKSIAVQTMHNFEVIIAQDSNSSVFDELIKSYANKFPILHLQQEDNGFLKNKILNEAIRVSTSDKLVFIDGDCVIHPAFLSQYEKNINRGVLCMGRRVDLDKKTTEFIKSGKAIYPGIIQMIKNGTTRVEERFYLPWLPQMLSSKPKLLGCNMGWHKSDLVHLNGFDEDYTNPGYGEDSDIEWRAKAAGMSVFSMRYKAIQYHLDHARPDRQKAVTVSQKLFEQKKEEGRFRCINGMVKLTDQPDLLTI